MSVPRVQKQIDSIEEFVDEKSVAFRHRVFVITDSKGRYISKYLERRDFVEIVYRGGARIGDKALLGRLRGRISGLSKPIVMLWLGTCDITQKQRGGSAISMRQTDVKEIINRLQEMILVIKGMNNSAEVVCLQCPAYSISIWNNKHGCEGDGKEEDKVLESFIEEFNSEVDAINSFYTPKFTLDLLKNTKTGTRSRYYLNFNALYLDGIHPGEIISKLWFLKMKKLALDRHE